MVGGTIKIIIQNISPFLVGLNRPVDFLITSALTINQPKQLSSIEQVDQSSEKTAVLSKKIDHNLQPALTIRKIDNNLKMHEPKPPLIN